VFKLTYIEGDWYWRLDIMNDDGLIGRQVIFAALHKPNGVSEINHPPQLFRPP
jgi:hypothetical protein